MIRPTFTNYAGIFHTDDDFYIDFVHLCPGPLGKPVDAGEANGEVVARLTMSPTQAKRLLEALSTNVATYELNVKPIGDVKPQAAPNTIN